MFGKMREGKESKSGVKFSWDVSCVWLHKGKLKLVIKT
jgi:hypothetical protein